MLVCLGGLSAHDENNLITNPGFESENTGFTTSYSTNNANATAQGQAKIYSANVNSGTSFGSGSTTYSKRSGSKFFAVNGASDGTSTVWQQSVTIAPNISYTFTFFAAPGDAASVTTKPVIDVTVTINGNAATLSAVTNPTWATAGTYTQYSATFTSNGATSPTTAVIKLVDTATGSTGNDFLLDDFSLVPEPSTYAAGIFVVGAGFFAWRRQRRTAQSVA